MSQTAPSFLTPWHPGTQKVTDATRVFFIGKDTRSLSHACAGLKMNESPKTVTLEKPTHFATPAGYCPACDTLFIGEDPR